MNYSLQEATQIPLNKKGLGYAFGKSKSATRSKKARPKKPNIVSYTAAELAKMEGKTDWARVAALTDEEIIKAVESDPDAQLITEEDWANAVSMYGNAPVKRIISIRLDYDVVDFFKTKGRDYQTRINKVLRAYMKAQK